MKEVKVYQAIEAAQDQYARVVADQFEALFGKGSSQEYRNISFELGDGVFIVEAEAVNPIRFFSMEVQIAEDADADEDDSKNDDDEFAYRNLLIEICQRQFGGDKWGRYTDEYLDEVAERAIEQAHAHAINEDADREEYREVTRAKNLEIIARYCGLSGRQFSLYDDETVATAAASVLDAVEGEARKENERRDRARSALSDFTRSMLLNWKPQFLTPGYLAFI